LDYNEVYLAEGPWPGRAYRDAAERESRRLPPIPLDALTLHRRTIVTGGPYPQQIVPAPAMMPGELPRNVTPNGTGAPAVPPELVPPGATNPGASDTLPPPQPGTLQPGTLQPGTLQPGTLQPGTLQPGKVQRLPEPK
jgi:hypothetical protein